jgi:ATP-dependent DNA helicase RecG
VEGVSLNNLLTTDPRPRNPLLADACKRIGLVERTGRGIDLIYRGLLRYGRQQPDYSGTDAHNVVLRLNLGEANLAFLEMVLQEEARRGTALPTDSLIALSALREHKRLSSDDLSEFLQKNRASAVTVLEALVESGLAQPHGATRGRTYTLSPQVYRELGAEVEYTRQAGFDRLQQEQMVRQHVQAHGRIRRSDVMALCRLDRDKAYRLLSRMTDEGILARRGETRATYYERGEKF